MSTCGAGVVPCLCLALLMWRKHVYRDGFRHPSAAVTAKLHSWSHHLEIPPLSAAAAPTPCSHTPFPPYAAHSSSQVSPLLGPVWFMRSLLSTGQGLIFTSRMFARLSFIDGEVTPRWRLFSGWVVFRDQILITNEHVNIFFTFDYLLFDEWIHGKGQLLRIMFPCLMMWKHSFIESCSATQQQLITHFRPQIWVSELQLQLSFMGWVFSHVALEEKFRLILRETWMCVQHFMEIHIQHTHIQ